MILQLSGLTEELPRLYRELNGRVIDTMPLMISGRDEKGRMVDVPRVPVSFAYVLERREKAPEDVREAWQNNYVFTGDLVATGVDGDILSVWDSPLLRSLTSESKLSNGALVLSTAQWDELKSQKEGTLYLTAEEAAQAHQKGYTKQGAEWVPAHKQVARIWDHLGRGRTLQSHAQMASATTHSESIMHVYLDASARQLPTGRAWVANRVDNNSDANGDDDLNIVIARLVGVAPEAHVAREKVLEARVRAAVDAGMSFERADGLLYVPVDREAATQLRR